MFDFVDKYKYGIIAAFAAAIGIFIYLQLTYVPDYFEIVPFGSEPELKIVKEEELLLTPENLEIQPKFEQGKVVNAVRDMNDKREQTDERRDQEYDRDNSSSHKSMRNVDQSVKDYEQEILAGTGGEAKRAAIKKADEQRKKDQSSSTKSDKPTKPSNDPPPPPKGNVMVDWTLANRSPHQGKESNICNPGYKCGHGSSGRVAVSIKVGQDGRVISANVDPAGTTSANPCMIEEAIRYAKKSRFDYSGSAPESQSGKIYYTFVSQ